MLKIFTKKPGVKKVNQASKSNNDKSGSWHIYRQMEQIWNFTMTYGELIEDCLVENN